MNNHIRRQAVIVAAVIATIVVNGLANALPINGLTTGEISDRFDVYFVPAAYVFSIWGLIYIGLTAYAVYQALPTQRENPRLKRIAFPFILGNLGNIAWIFLWHYEMFPLTIVAMLILLFSLISIYLRLEIGRTTVSRAEAWFVRVPFSIYLGWITVATIANVTSLLDYLQWNGWGISEQAWTAVMLVAGLLITGAVAITRRDFAYVLVIIWAFAGIGVKHAGVTFVSTSAWVAVGLASLLALWTLVRNVRPGQSGQPAH
jgi:hypothetical protein